MHVCFNTLNISDKVFGGGAELDDKSIRGSNTRQLTTNRLLDPGHLDESHHLLHRWSARNESRLLPWLLVDAVGCICLRSLGLHLPKDKVP